jgi:protein-disulfide isomerase
MKRHLPFGIVAVVALLTLGSGAMLYRAKRLPLLKISKDQIASGKESAISVHLRGNPKAQTTVEEFGDFECPPCGKLAEPLKEVEREQGDRLRMIFHHFPLITHRYAKEAAYAAEAAGLQGRFWEMHDLLYKEQGVWSRATDVRELFNAYAGMLGLNVERFKKDIDSEQVKTRVAADEKRGNALGVTNTPTVFINDTAVPPASLNPVSLHAAINDAVNSAGQKDKAK